MAMRLQRYRVTSFRSVVDSGWIETSDVTALIGTNESGKTNLLLPLWKLNPANEGEINETADFPRKDFNDFRRASPKPVFVEADFELGTDLAERLAALTSLSPDGFSEARVARRFDGSYSVTFPHAVVERSCPLRDVQAVLQAALEDIAKDEGMKTEQSLRSEILASLDKAASCLPGQDLLAATDLEPICEIVAAPDVSSALKGSTVVPRYTRCRDELNALRDRLSMEGPDQNADARKLVLKHLPKFVYYSNYGNLDSEIYLPQVIQNLERENLGAKEEAKARTLKVLFDFVKLKPVEIHELGRDFSDPRNPARAPTDAEVDTIREKKKQRSILLQSASTKLTKRFREWWKQGDYRFRFDADGDHFRIWVADEKRPEEIELEGRSTGLQWFLSFYLVFLVESEDAHEDAILLLDEPGLSLHPNAQQDLSAFFDGLSKTNQLLYTTHSPFMIDPDQLDRVRKVFVAKDGSSKATADLRAEDGDPTKRGAAYAVHAALGLSVGETFLYGCTPVVVEGPSDQHYLSTIKTLLIAAGELTPGRELIFPAAGGARGVKALAAALGSRADEPPVALFDSDRIGQDTAAALRNGLYAGAAASRVLQVGMFVPMDGAEVEDLFPPELVAREVDRWQRLPEVSMEDSLQPNLPIVPQVEAWAKKHGVELMNPGWKVDLAKRLKARLLKTGVGAVAPEYLAIWRSLFAAFKSASLQ